VFALPKLKNPIKGFLGDVSLKKAADGRKDTMWTNPEKYPAIADIDLVSDSSPPLADSVQRAVERPSKQWKPNSKRSSSRVGATSLYVSISG